MSLSDTRTAMPVDVVSDVVCPWCFIGKRRLEKAIALAPDIPLSVRWRPYFLNPWVPREGIGRTEYLTTKFGSVETYARIAERIAAAAEAEGLVYRVEAIARQPNTLDCHRLIRWAGADGAAGPGEGAGRMKQRLMELYFSEGADLTARDVLVQAAVDCGMDAMPTSWRSPPRPWPRAMPGSRACRASSSAGCWQSRAHRPRTISPALLPAPSRSSSGGSPQGKSPIPKQGPTDRRMRPANYARLARTGQIRPGD